MASYTDQITQFTPYISRMPLIQEMSAVAQEKQAKYDQGVQKIQSYIDNIAGMEIMNNTQKQHLQSKLNELGNNLKVVAAGDFSNQQLVNSVGGMATNIIKDPIVQNAVYSTQKAKNELATANNLYKEGKSSLRNVNALSEQINQYANSTDVNATFNGKYVNYIDLSKKYQELADNLKKNAPEKSIDNPNITDSEGRTIYYKRDDKGKIISASIDPRSGGVPQPDITMKRFTIKGVSAQTLYDAFKASLTGDDIEQMKIDAWDHYKGQGAESIIRDLVGSTDLAKQILSKEIEKLKVDLHDKNLTYDEQTKIQSDINKYQDKLNNGSFEKDLTDATLALQNPATLEKAKYDAYVKKTLNQQATTLSNQSYKEELLASPIEAANHARAVLQESIREHNLVNTRSLESIKETKLQNAWTREQAEKKWKAEHPGLVTEDMPVPTNIITPSSGTLSKDIVGLNDKITQLGNDYKDVLGLGKYGLDLLYKKYKADPSSVIGNNALAYVTARDVAERDIVRKNNLKNLVDEGSKVFDTKIDAKLSAIKGVTDSSGKQIYSAKELNDIDELLRKYYVINTAAAGVGGVSTYTTFNEAAFRKSIGNDPKRMEIADALVKRIKGEVLTPKEKIIANRLTEVHKEIDPTISTVQKEKADYQASTISKYDPFYQQQYGTLNKDNKEDMAALDNLIGNTILKLNTPGFGVDIQSGEKLDAITLSKMRAKNAEGKLTVVPIVIKNYDGSALVELHQGDAVQTIHVTAANFAKYYPEYAKTNRFSDDFSAVAVSKNKTTNTSMGPGNTPADAVTAAHTGFEIPLLARTPWANKVRYDIIGDRHNDGDPATDRFGIRLFIHDNNKWIPVDSQGGFKSAASVQQDIEQLIGPDTIEGLLKKHK